MTDIVIEDVTTGTIDGTGIFDKLMVSVKSHIQDEYDKGRLKGADYANVYLGVMQAVLAQSIEFSLREKQTETQIKLTEAQIKESYTDRVLKDKQAAMLGLDNVMKTGNTSPEAVYTPKYEE